MRRILLAATGVVALLAVMAPAALAAGPVTGPVVSTGEVAITVGGTLDVPAGTHVRAIVVVNGTATIAGSADSLVVIDGTATVTGAAVGDVVVVDGQVDLLGTSTAGDVATLRGSVTREATASITGRSTTLEGSLAALGLLLAPLAVLFTVGLALAALVAGVAMAAFGGRQVRDLEARISGQPGQVLVAGIIGTIALPVLSVLLVATVVGAPLGLFLLVIGVPVLAFAGWLVAAVWVGDWLLVRSAGAREGRHPYRAAILGVIVLALASLLPLVSAVATVFGLGAMLLAGWDSIRPERTADPVDGTATGWQAAPSAG